MLKATSFKLDKKNRSAAIMVLSRVFLRIGEVTKSFSTLLPRHSVETFPNRSLLEGSRVPVLAMKICRRKWKVSQGIETSSRGVGMTWLIDWYWSYCVLLMYFTRSGTSFSRSTRAAVRGGTLNVGKCCCHLKGCSQLSAVGLAHHRCSHSEALLAIRRKVAGLLEWETKAKLHMCTNLWLQRRAGESPVTRLETECEWIPASGAGQKMHPIQKDCWMELVAINCRTFAI